MKVNRTDVRRVVEAVLELENVRQATVFRSPTLTVRATRRWKHGRDFHNEIMLTIGRPNFAEREFIRDCQKAGEPFPVRKIQLKFYKTKGG